METLTDRHAEVFQQFYPDLVNVLPMNDVTFIAILFKRDLLSGNLKDLISAKNTRQEKSTYFLDNSIKINIDRNLEILFTAMDNSGYKNVKELAKRMRAALKSNCEDVTRLDEQTSIATKMAAASIFPQIKDRTLKPTIKEINTYVKNQYAVFWKDIAIELEMHYGKVEDIEKKCYDNETRICTVLYTWLDTSCNVSWKALEVAIINAQRIQEGLDPIEDLDEDPPVSAEVSPEVIDPSDDKVNRNIMTDKFPKVITTQHLDSPKKSQSQITISQHDNTEEQKKIRRTVVAYQKAFKKGKRRSNKFKIVLVGAEGAGKTSTAHSLLGKKFEQQQPSTVGAAVNTCTADRFFATQWKQITLDHQLKQLPNQLKHELKSCISKMSTEEAELPRPGEVSSSMQPDNKSQAESTPPEIIPEELVAKVQEIVETQEIHDGDIQIVILDLGGQEIYYHVHFLFLAQEDVVFLTFDASKDLDEPVICRQRLTRFQDKVETRGMQTNLQTIEILMQSVSSHCGKFVGGKVYISNRIPTIILVATHSKSLTLQQKNAISKKIYQKFTGRPFMDHLPRSKNEAIFFVDNSDGDPKVFEALQAVTLKAAEPTIAKEAPISYLQFEADVLKESQKRAVISKQEALAIAQKAALQNDLMEVLNHYTLKGTLLYYPEVESLQNEVFVLPQEVSDMISSVISTHNCEPSSTDLQRACDRYDSFGLLEENLLDDMLKSADRYKDKTTILGFLEKFHLAVEVSRDTKFAEEDASYETPTSNRVFLVPSMLVYNTEVVPVKREGDMVLSFHFPDKFVPENVFNQVLVNLVSWCKLQGHHVHSILHGVGCFQFKGRAQSFKLQRCSQSYCIKCYISVHQQNLTSDVLDTMLLHRQQLRHHLEECIQDAHQAHIPCARSPIGYLECPLHESVKTPPHIRLDELTPYGRIACPKSMDCQAIPREAYALLFVPSLTCTSHKPTYQNLLPYMEHVDNWKVLGTHLLPEKYLPHLINEIDRTHRGNVEDCRGALLSEYIKVGDVSWDKIISSLEKSHYTNVADMIKQDILNN